MSAMADAGADLDAQRLALAGTLIYKERRRRHLDQLQLADEIGISRSTLSKIENGRKIGDDSLFDIGLVFGWGGFLEFVLSGNLDATNSYDNVDEEIRRFAVYRLREIADPDRYRKPYGGFTE